MENFKLPRKVVDPVSTTGSCPKVCIDVATHTRLKEAVQVTGLPISAIAVKALNYALDHLEYFDA